MSLTPTAPGPGEAVERRTTTTTYSGKVPWPWLLAAAVVVPLLLTLLAVFTTRGAIRDDLSAQSQRALATAGIAGAQVEVDARDVTLTDVPAGAEQSAIDAVRGVAGVQSVQVAGTLAPLPPPAAPTPDVVVSREAVVLRGAVGSEAERGALSAAAQRSAGTRPVTQSLTVVDGAVSGIAEPGFAALVAAVGQLPASVSYDGTTATISGDLSDADTAALDQQVRAAFPTAAVVDRRAPTTPTAPAPSGLDNAAVQQQINSLLTANPVTFVTDSLALTATGGAAVDQVAALLVANPGARVQINGYVNDTGASADSLRAVSEQRAITVRDRMAQDGVAADRMTTAGLGAGDGTGTDSRRVEIVVL